MSAAHDCIAGPRVPTDSPSVLQCSSKHQAVTLSRVARLDHVECSNQNSDCDGEGNRIRGAHKETRPATILFTRGTTRKQNTRAHERETTTKSDGKKRTTFELLYRQDCCYSLYLNSMYARLAIRTPAKEDEVLRSKYPRTTA